jgi:predicted O-linked N-acetylglucosamine transferase (SPINDLY family)
MLLRRLRHRARRAGAPADSTARLSELLERGRTALREERYADAECALLEILTADSGQLDALSMLGQVYMRRLQFDTALDYFDEVARRAGDLAASHANRAWALLGLGRYAEALEGSRRAAALEPDSFFRAADVLFVLNQDPRIAPEQRYAEHRRVAERFLDRVPRLEVPKSRFDDPERRLRIGYVSGDFRDHAVAFFIEPLLASRDRTAFEVFCYQTLGKQDARTERWRTLADAWYEVKGVADETLAQAIVDHRIDILVDLAGLTRGSRALALARKPAPVQISYLGYLATTGSRTIDYRITDALADPPGAADRCYSEQLIRLPRTLWCFSPWVEMPAPAARVDASDAPIVFGSFNRLTKLHPPLLRLWARLLGRVANSELWILDVPSEDVRERLLAAFREIGIAESRVITYPRQLREEYWQTIRRADIALDPFPYNGGATTCECLWLGVPVVTKAGAMGFARSGASILGNVGLAEFVAESDEKYLEIAAVLATDRPRLRALQRGLRDRMRASPLLDAPGFMRDLEHVYREVWRRACAADRRAAASVTADRE